MWAVLGEIEFEVLGSPVGWEQRSGAEFAEHARISSKPLLEALGGTLDEIAWDIRLHHRLHDVQGRLRQIREAVAAQEPLALVLGDGDYLGPWVISESSTIARKTAPGGRLVNVDLNILLREYTGEFTRATSKPGLAGAISLPGLVAQPGQPQTAAQQLVVAVRGVQNAVRSGRELAAGAMRVVANPSLLVSRLPDIAGAVAAGLEGSDVVRAIGASVQGAGEIVRAGAGIWEDLRSVRGALVPLQLDGIEGRLQRTSAALERSAQRLDSVRATVLQITAATAVRRM